MCQRLFDNRISVTKQNKFGSFMMSKKYRDKIIWHPCASFVAALAAGLCMDAAASPVSSPKSAVIVVFQQATPFHQFRGNARSDERFAAAPQAWDYLDRGVLGAVQRLEALHGFKSQHVYSHAVSGFAGELTQVQIEALRSDPTVAYIEPDHDARTTAQVLPWGVDRVEADISSTLAGNGSGAVTGVNVYVIDTGIATHPDLNLVRHVNFAGGRNTDCDGHGTHVAGTIGAIDNARDVVGVAPGVPLTGVKVFGCSGSGYTSTVIKGVDWVTANAITPAVANMSLGAVASQALDDAVRRSVASNIFYAIAAGNDGANACDISPARSGLNSNGTSNGIVTTAAINADELETTWSNYGNCVDIWAPGDKILSTRLGGRTTTQSGTSMAAPHVAGAAALYLSRNTAATPAQIEQVLGDFAAPALNGTLSKDGRAIQLLKVNSF
jgi:subtilisin family serine protease